MIQVPGRLRLFNSLTGRKEEFHPVSPLVGVYVCGITPYDTTHLGHAFTYVVFDVLVRYLRYMGCRVRYVQNLTDVDDDILRKASEEGKDWRRLVEINTARFLDDMHWLNNLQPDVYPRASDHIVDMIQLIQRLLDSGVAYRRDQWVYFKAASREDFGRLSRLPRDQMIPISQERGNDPSDPRKSDPLDFVLWQPSSPGEPSWESPWGRGRPGWHIECSAMALRYLGETVDIYGGGRDLIFPHHECSLAQSESITGKPLARFWLHTAMVRYQGEKMSKSLGNLVFLGDLKSSHRPNEVRMLLLGHHYREEWTFQEEELARVRLKNDLLRTLWHVQSSQGPPLEVSAQKESFFEALNDDLDTPRALDVIHSLAQRIVASHTRMDVSQAKAFIMEALNILGLSIEYS